MLPNRLAPGVHDDGMTTKTGKVSELTEMEFFAFVSDPLNAWRKKIIASTLKPSSNSDPDLIEPAKYGQKGISHTVL